jgi:hypothetical protein
MIRLDYRLTLTLQAPLLSHAAGALTLGLDAALQRYHGHIVLNGSLIRGNLRQLLEAMVQALSGEPAGSLLQADLETWLGLGADRNDLGLDGARRARLAFDYFWRLDPESVGPPPDQDQRFRVEIAPTGTAKDGSLLVIEEPFAIGEEPVFAGFIGACFADEAERERCERWMGKALGSLTALGAYKGVGFGRVLEASLASIVPVLQTRPAPAEPLAGDRLGLVLRLDRPFNAGLDALHQPQGNRWLHQDNIPGLVLKGVLAQALDGDSSQLRERLCFDDLIVSNATPARPAAPGRRLPLPLSLAVVEDGPGHYETRDLALQSEPCLLAIGGRAQAPCFLPDWKDAQREAAERAFGEPELGLERLLSVRTAILPEGRVSAEGQLFALECTDPWGHVWCSDLDLDSVPESDRPRVCDNLVELLAPGLENIGKTKARARVRLVPGGLRAIPNPAQILAIAPDGRDRAAGEPLTAQDRFIVLLCSPARLLPARWESDRRVPATNGHRQLHALYDDYWRHASDGRLGLGHHFAQQDLIGGTFYWKHYRGGDDGYRPEWLTVPGSVFALAPLQLDLPVIQALLHRWLRRGLPPAPDRDRPDEDWRSDPFIPQNGFGEVCLGYPQWRKLAPRPDEIVSIPGAGDDDAA